MATLIELTNYCQAFSCLPKDGGLEAQDPHVLEGMYLVLAAQDERRRLDAEVEAAKHRH